MTHNDEQSASTATSRAGAGLLIVNADDWGCNPEETRAIAACFTHGAITSTTAFVWMRDSRRAAELAVEQGLPVGLHVNLDLPYTAADVSEGARGDQAEVCRVFSARRSRLRAYLPVGRLRRLLRATISAQLEEFERIYGRPPTHFDSHHHALQSVPAAFFSLPKGTKVRNPRWQASSAASRLLRNWRRPIIRHRFVTTARFFDLVAVHPALGGSEIERVLSAADTTAVELMTHPHFRREFDVLCSDAWIRLLSGRSLGSFADL